MNNIFQTLNFGWVCIKCGRVYNPTVLECIWCNSKLGEAQKQDNENKEDVGDELNEYAEKIGDKDNKVISELRDFYKQWKKKGDIDGENITKH